MSNIVEVVVADRNLATMSKSVKAAGMDTVLSQKGPFTIFAPTNIAFGKLDGGKLERLLQSENKEKLTELLSHHVVEGLLNYSDLQHDQKLVTSNGRELTVKVADGKVTINGATVQGRDSVGINGVVHSLDTVLQLK
jgi:uncharacterized surface protein with fasciclin (FAS1) repeats